MTYRYVTTIATIVADHNVAVDWLKRCAAVLLLLLVVCQENSFFALGPSDLTTTTIQTKSTKILLAPLSEYLEQGEATGEFMTSAEGIKSTTDLLDLVVIGFAKSGTSTLHQWLDLHPQITMLRGENHHLGDAPGKLIQELYKTRQKLQSNHSAVFPHYIGFKNPNEIRRLNTSMAYLGDYFPSTKLIVTVRHPVTWFKSLWDYSIMFLRKNDSWLRQHLQIGGPHGLSDGIQTGNAEWHVLLALLGKTNGTTEELELLQDFLRPHEVWGAKPKLPNPIFLMETTQMADDDPARAAQLRYDMQHSCNWIRNYLPFCTATTTTTTMGHLPFDRDEHRRIIFKRLISVLPTLMLSERN